MARMIMEYIDARECETRSLDTYTSIARHEALPPATATYDDDGAKGSDEHTQEAALDGVFLAAEYHAYSSAGSYDKHDGKRDVISPALMPGISPEDGEKPEYFDAE
ncbi:hypothetical protein NPX13_g11169 [Xylaria arbuscula]|uniref:Uncharacterized protein n=1 Tax=Xylaria arbuscula TaxID=114810 RepID=A0A9W8N3C6_9PEZI|nr:hypothetical protein NPX13_g11169 [Xylaria arbuscula]